MKLSLQKESLLKPLQMVMGVVDRKKSVPILSNVLLDAIGNHLSIVGTDLEVELVGQSYLAYEIPTASKLTVPGRKLLDICRALPEGAPIELYLDKQKIIIHSERSRFTLSTLPAEEFPSVEHQQAQISLTLLQQDLRYLLQRTSFAMAQQDVRYYLNGLLLEFAPNTLRAVATDGHRLATNVIQASITEEHRLKVIVPRKSVIELQRLLDDSDQEVTLAVGTGYIRATGDDYIFTSKLVEGRFPDYQQVIPRNGDKVLTMKRDTLKQALNRNAILCNEKFCGVCFELDQDLLRISTNSPEQDIAEEELMVEWPYGYFSINFNINYLLDVLNALSSEKIRLIFSDPSSSVLIEESEDENDSAFVVMPLRI